MPLGANKAAIMGVAGVSAAGDAVLITESAFTNQTNVSFTSQFTSTYQEYIIGIYMINPATDGAELTFNGSIDGGSNYNVEKTSNYFYSQHAALDSSSIAYRPAGDIAAGTGYQSLMTAIGNAAAESGSLIMHLWNPASTVYVKHFNVRAAVMTPDLDAYDTYVSGYFNTASAMDAFDFKMSAGNFDGTIKIWGVK